MRPASSIFAFIFSFLESDFVSIPVDVLGMVHLCDACLEQGE